MTTIQTQAHRGTYTPSSRVRSVKGFVIGFVALVAAATAIGIATSGTTEAPATVIAPVSHTAPNTEAREAMNRVQGTSSVTAPESEAIWYPSGAPVATAPESEVVWYPSGAPDVTNPESEVVLSQPGKPGIR